MTLLAAWWAVIAVVGAHALSGCGATSTPAVASVQGTAISRADLAHWTRIKRIELESRSKPKSTPSPLPPERKALLFLITADWLQAEAAAQGVIVSLSQTERTYHELVSGPTGQAFANGLTRRGMSRADELLQLRLDSLTQKLQTKIGGHVNVSAAQIAAYYDAHTSQFQGHAHPRRTLAGATAAIRQTLLAAERERQVAAFVAAYRQRWKQRTTCQPGYIVAECRTGPPLSTSRTE